MSRRTTLHFADEAAAIADVKRLRKGCQPAANWTLTQACWHVATPMGQGFRPPNTTTSTPDQKQMQGFLENVVANGWPTERLPSPPNMVPPPSCGPEAIDSFITAFTTLSNYNEQYIDLGPFGPVETPKAKRFFLNHAARHLSFFTPTT